MRGCVYSQVARSKLIRTFLSTLTIREGLPFSPGGQLTVTGTLLIFLKRMVSFLLPFSSFFACVPILNPLTFRLMTVNWKLVVSHLSWRGHRLSSESGGKVPKVWRRFGDATWWALDWHSVTTHDTPETNFWVESFNKSSRTFNHEQGHFLSYPGGAGGFFYLLNYWVLLYMSLHEWESYMKGSQTHR